MILFDGIVTCAACGRRIETNARGDKCHKCPKSTEGASIGKHRSDYDVSERAKSYDQRINDGCALQSPNDYACMVDRLEDAYVAEIIQDLDIK